DALPVEPPLRRGPAGPGDLCRGGADARRRGAARVVAPGTPRDPGRSGHRAARGVRPSAELDVGSGWQAAAEIFGAKPAGRGDQGAGVLHLVPGVPEKDSADAAGGEVIDDTLAERRLPVGEGFAARVELADGLVAQLEEVRVKEGQVAVGSPVSCHRAARG